MAKRRNDRTKHENAVRAKSIRAATAARKVKTLAADVTGGDRLAARREAAIARAKTQTVETSDPECSPLRSCTPSDED